MADKNQRNVYIAVASAVVLFESTRKLKVTMLRIILNFIIGK